MTNVCGDAIDFSMLHQTSQTLASQPIKYECGTKQVISDLMILTK